MKTQVAIFDFDGTIADSYDYVLNFLKREARNKKRITQNQQLELRGYSMIQMARRLGMPYWRMPFLFLKGRREMAQHLDGVKLFPGVKKVLAELHKQKIPVFIVSSNSSANIVYYLEQHNLDKYVMEVFGGAGIFGKGPLLRRLVKKYGFKRQDCWYIGDEALDTLTARRLRLKSLAVTWGYNNLSILMRAKPASIAKEPADIVKYINS